MPVNITKPTLYEASFRAMGSPCNLSLYCPSDTSWLAAKAITLDELERLEAKYSRYRPNSILSQINDQAGTGKTTSLDDETWWLLQYANTAFQQSNGLFDITSGVLRKAWDFSTRKANSQSSFVLPSETQIEQLLSLIGWQQIPLEQSTFMLPKVGMELDFGGIVKEYAADRIAALIQAHGIHHGLIDLAGDIRVIGPHPNDEPWLIGISHPEQPQQAIAHIPMRAGGLASSGDYARSFTLQGTRYSHILNPKTGWPTQGLVAVSVWAEQCVVAGTLATAAMLKGTPNGTQWLTDTNAAFLCIDDKMTVTQSKQ